MFGYDWPRLHAALNDLPTALLVAAVLFDLIGALGRRPAFRQVGFWTLILGVLGTIAAVVSGLRAEEQIDHGDAVHRVMQTHEQLGLITLGVFAVLALWRIFREARMGGTERALSRVVSLVGMGMVVATGVYGGRLVFDHAAGIPSEVLQSELQNRAAGHQHAAGEAHDHGEGAADGHGSSATLEHAGGEAHEHGGDEPHDHAGSEAGRRDGGSVARPDSVAQRTTTRTATKPAGHAHPSGTPPHSHSSGTHSDSSERHTHAPGGHSHPADTPPHQH